MLSSQNCFFFLGITILRPFHIVYVFDDFKIFSQICLQAFFCLSSSMFLWNKDGKQFRDEETKAKQFSGLH